jgi:tetratricopeptide (TPR) repeat protein
VIEIEKAWRTLAIVALALCGLVPITSWAKSDPKPSDSVRTVIISPLPVIEQRALDYYVSGLVAEGVGDIASAAILYDSAWNHCPQSAEIGISYAQMLIQVRRLTEAVSALERIMPPTAAQLALKGFCYRQLKEDDKARDTYLQMLTLDSSQGVGYMFLANYYEQEKNPDSALWALRHLARVMPDNFQVLNELGKALFAHKDLPLAKETFRRSLELMPASSNMEALLNLADIFDRNKQTDSLFMLFEIGLQSNPDNAFLHRELSRLLLEKDSVSQALPHMWAAARLEPNDYTTQRRLAVVLISIDSLATADSILTQLVQAGDSEPADHFYLGRVAALKQDFPRAADEFRIVTERAPSIPDAWLSLGFIQRRLGQPELEIQTYQDALQHMTEEQYAIQLYIALGAAFEQNNMVDSAIATFETLLQHNPDHGMTLNYLGYMLADRGIRLEYARDLLERAVKLEPKNAAYLDSYGWVYYRLGKFNEAVKYLKTAVELDSDPVIYDHLGDAYQAVGKTKQAREWWQKALDLLPDNEAIKLKLQH